MDELSPSLKASAKGIASDGLGFEGRDTGGSYSGETVVGRCTAAALATGVDCVLDEEYSASRETGRIAGFSQVRINAVMAHMRIWY